MSGHSKWSTIKRKKGAEDAKRGKIFTRIARDLMLAAKNGGGDPNSNPALRLAMDKARAANMPKDNIERAVKKGTGELEGGQVDEITYEAYAPHGVPVLIQCITDNRNRTLADVRRILNKLGGNMAEAGSVSWMFDLKGYISLPKGSHDPDEVFMLAVEAGAEDVEVGDEDIEIYTASSDLHTGLSALEEAGITAEEAQLSQVPKNEIELGPAETVKIMNIIESLEELDDVDQVYSGLAISDEALAQMETA
jgi:YebC/PmpR family DNA-binding regulatory protein